MTRGFVAAALCAAWVGCSFAGTKTWREGAVLWQRGTADNASAEFASKNNGTPLTTVSTGTKEMPGGLYGSKNAELQLSFALKQVPVHGTVFSLKLLDATLTGPQMAVFVNEQMAGLIQLWGTAPMKDVPKWRKTYSLYIPSTLLANGENKMTLRLVPPMWSEPAALDAFWIEWDYLKLSALAEAPREPIHGKMTYLGTTFKHTNRGFDINDKTIELANLTMPWMGCAYGGNTMRADFWYDVAKVQPARLELLKKFKELNATAVADFIAGHIKLDPNGTLPQKAKDEFAKFFDTYGSLLQFYELGNEPCMFGGDYKMYAETAKHVFLNRPEHLRLVATGWAFGGGKGTPVNWDADPKRRLGVERYCDLLNGHSYGYSYASKKGGSFIENLLSYGQTDDGWMKEFLNTETGANNWHSEENGPRYQSSQSRASAFDRVIRAHVAVVDRTMQHALIFGDTGGLEDFGLFKGPDWNDIKGTLKALDAPDGGPRKLETFRRLVCAYATHGAPLEAKILNPAETANRLVYVRVVDTAALPGQAGSQAVSDKVLVNLVNFENSEQTVNVRVTLPRKGNYTAMRIGNGVDYVSAHKDLGTLAAEPHLTYDEKLQAGEAVQIILTPVEPITPYAPQRVNAEMRNGKAVVTWAACAGADDYECIRKGRDGTITTSVQGCRWEDALAKPGERYDYQVRARSKAGTSPFSAQVNFTAGVPDRPRFTDVCLGDGMVSLTLGRRPKDVEYFLEREDRSGRRTMVRGISGLTAIDKDLTNGAFYRYYLYAKNQHGVSQPAISSYISPVEPVTTPQKVQVHAVNTRAVVQWLAEDKGATYDVLRAEGTGAFVPAVTDTAEGRYVDDTVQPGKSYSYQVVARSGALRSKPSETVTCKPAVTPLPKVWSNAAIGSSTNKGGAWYDAANGVFAVAAGGHDIWGEKDGLRLIYQKVKGDFVMSCRVINYDNTDPNTTFGIMARASESESSPHVMMGVAPKGAMFVSREQQGGLSKHRGGAYQPYVRLERKGGKLIGSLSPDGTLWREIGTADLPNAETAYVGLFACSHNNSKINQVFFDQVLLKEENSK